MVTGVSVTREASRTGARSALPTLLSLIDGVNGRLRCSFGAACGEPLGAGRQARRAAKVRCGALVIDIVGAAGTARAAASGGALIGVVVLLR